MEIPFVQGKQIQIYKVMIFDVFNKKKKKNILYYVDITLWFINRCNIYQKFD